MNFLRFITIFILLFSAQLLGIPDQNPDINKLVESLTKNHLFTASSSFDPIAQNSINPFLYSGFKQEVPDPEPFFNRQKA